MRYISLNDTNAETVKWLKLAFLLEPLFHNLHLFCHFILLHTTTAYVYRTNIQSHLF